ncbi:MAG: EF-hand domain-containing protein [Candidatus Poseidoniaceae archaeon]|nr:EF-hand domain-containing protein [Candidatus Poseidoniaceae archaeon]MBL6889052.1 EF-hand domain-containing protein [Candidatus Poseidoniaceae archaeon]
MSKTGDDGMTEENEEIAMAECGSCRAVVPITSTNCPECDISFSGVSEDALGECGACNSLVPLDSTKCPECGVVFVADDVIDILRTWMATNSMDVKSLFGRFDTNGDGRIDSDELKTGLLSLNLADLPPSQVDKLVQAIDEDGDSLVDLEELQTIIAGDNLVDETETTADESDDSEESLEYSENVLSKVMIAAEINDSDKEEFLAFAENYNSDDNSYLKKEELQTAADAWNARSEADESDNEAPESEEEIKAPAEEESAEEIVEHDSEEEIIEEELEEELDEITEEADEEELIEEVIDEESVEEETEEELVESETEDRSLSQIYEDILDSIDEQDLTLSTAFGNMDEDGNRMVTREELGSKLSIFLEYELSESELDSMMESMDENSDGNIDMIEFVTSIENHEDSIASIDDEEAETVKTFPSKWHSRFMSKQWHDVFWPLIHTGLAILIVAALANGLFPFVDGEGGTVELETEAGDGWMNADGIVIDEGQAYPCDSTVQVGECKNSLTPLAGDASSMPGGFYLDGIILMIFSTIGLIGSLYTHLVLAPSWRARVKAMKEVSEDKADVQESLEDDDETEEESEELEDDVETEDDDTEDHETEDDSSEEESDPEDDELDIGSYVGVDIDGEEYYGTIVEFDDDEETVTIEEEESGDEITAYQDEMFVPED